MTDLTFDRFGERVYQSEGEWFVYLVRTKSGKLYCGITTDVWRRLYEHNNTKRGAKCLRGDRPVGLCWWDTQPDKSTALKREHEIKAMPRHAKWALVEMDKTVLPSATM